MSYLLLGLGILLLALALLALFARAAQGHRRLNPRIPGSPVRPSPSAQLHRLQTGGAFRGVRIESHCGASSHLVGEEFPFDHAPRLPVENCPAAVCECGYVGLPERRRGNTRRSGNDRRDSIRVEANDRRSQRSRRKDDLNAWGTYNHL